MSDRYLELSIHRLKEHLPFEEEMLLSYYENEGKNDWSTEVGNAGMTYCIFSFPELNLTHSDSLEDPSLVERVVLLVYDEQDRIIADCAARAVNLSVFMLMKEVYDFLSEKSDWMYLLHYTLSNYYFPELPYPYCNEEKQLPKEYQGGEVLLYTNAYVTKEFRRRGIFSCMVQMMQEFALRYRNTKVKLYTGMSLDPDIAVYGPDAVDEPYYYSFEADEPVRLLNKQILEEMGFEVLRLEETEPDPNADGTKLWFALKEETGVPLENEYQS